MPARVEVGGVAGSEAVGERLWLVHLELPEVAPQVRPGQFVLVRCAEPEYPVFDPYLPRAFFVFAVDRAAGRLSLLVEVRGRGSAWLASRRGGHRVLVHGPIGREVRPERLTRHLLLLADGTVGAAGLALLADEAAQRGLSVTLVENVPGGGGSEGGLPAHLLRADVEYRATTPEAGGLLGALPGLIGWADEAIVAAPAPLLDTFAALRRSRLEPFTLYANSPVQAIVLPALPDDRRPTTDDRGPEDSGAVVAQGVGGGDFVPCGSGVCGACVVATRGGPRLYCREGPAFALEELRFEEEDLTP